MSFSITGTIVEIKPTQQVTETFQKREFVLLKSDQYFKPNLKQFINQ